MSSAKNNEKMPPRLALSVAVATALLTGYGGRKAYAACTTSGGTTIVTCTGDHSGGIASGTDFTAPPVDTLNVNNLTTGIAPAAADGINFTVGTGNNITINADTTGTAGITTTGDIAQGIYGVVVGNGNSTITSTGNISTEGQFAYGIFGYVGGNGDVSITSTGNISTESSRAQGINGYVYGNGDVSITSTGDISTMGDNADGINGHVYGNGNVSITSTGDISTEGRYAYGIFGFVNGNGNVSITSIGDISSGSAAGRSGSIFGFVNGNGNVSITSIGNIFSSAPNQSAIIGLVRFGDGDVSISSTGDIFTTDTEASGIDGRVNGNGDVSITNIGNITTTGYSGRGIKGAVYGDGNLSISSIGDISTSANNSQSWAISGRQTGTGNMSITSIGNLSATNANAINARMDGTGTIDITVSGTLSGLTGIRVSGGDYFLSRSSNWAPATITTSAAITGTNGTAIDLSGDANDTVNVLPGASFNGAIDFGNGNDGMGGTNANDIDTLNALPGFNGVINFADTGDIGQGDTDLESAPEIVSSNIALVNGGTTAVAFDPSGFAASSMFLGSFTGAILNSIDNGNTPAANGNASSSFTGLQANGLSQRHWVSGLGGRQEIKTAGNSGVSGFTANGVASPYALDFGSTVWVSVFGGHQEVDAADNNTDLDHDFVGLMAGAESNFNQGTLGLFGGYGTSDVEIAYDAGSTETDTLFAGAYWKKDYSTHRVNLALIAGLTDQEFRREINGATPVTAKGETDGWFISPSATFTVPITALPVTTFGSVRVSYAGLFLDGYTETGVANPLTVSDRDIHLFNTRGQLAFPHDFDNEDGSSVHLEVRAGVDAQYNLDSDEVSGVVGGTPINFSADLDDRVSGFVGATLIRTNQKEDLTFAISGEVQSTFDGGYEAVGELKVVKRF